MNTITVSLKAGCLTGGHLYTHVHQPYSSGRIKAGCLTGGHLYTRGHQEIMKSMCKNAEAVFASLGHRFYLKSTTNQVISYMPYCQTLLLTEPLIQKKINLHLQRQRPDFIGAGPIYNSVLFSETPLNLGNPISEFVSIFRNLLLAFRTLWLKGSNA